MIRRVSTLLVVLVGAFGVSGLAADLGAADALFAQRENNLTNITKARAIYQEALGQVQGDELIHAVRPSKYPALAMRAEKMSVLPV